jgi:SAM-dependent methyltransferase
VLQRHGTPAIKRHLWNREFAEGRWECLYAMPDDCVYPHVEKHANGGDVLDLGCGPGAIGDGLNPQIYRSYVGVDISDVAIEKANARNKREKNAYIQADILSFVPQQKYDVILLGDSIYYFTAPQAKEIFERYSEFLKPGGVFLVRSWVTSRRTHALVQLIDAEYQVTERQWYCDFQLLVIAFRSGISSTIARVFLLFAGSFMFPDCPEILGL